MSQIKRLIKEKIALANQTEELIAFLAAIVHKNDDEIKITLQELEELPQKKFSVSLEDKVFTIKLT